MSEATSEATTRTPVGEDIMIWTTLVTKVRLTNEKDEAADQAGQGHTDVLRVPLSGVGDDGGVVALAQGEAHVPGAEDLDDAVHLDVRHLLPVHVALVKPPEHRAAELLLPGLVRDDLLGDLPLEHPPRRVQLG